MTWWNAMRNAYVQHCALCRMGKKMVRAQVWRTCQTGAAKTTGRYSFLIICILCEHLLLFLKTTTRSVALASRPPPFLSLFLLHLPSLSTFLQINLLFVSSLPMKCHMLSAHILSIWSCSICRDNKSLSSIKYLPFCHFPSLPDTLAFLVLLLSHALCLILFSFFTSLWPPCTLPLFWRCHHYFIHFSFLLLHKLSF